MKTFWNIVASLAVVNALALGGLLAWLQTTDRLSRDRIRLVREVFARTIGQETQDKVAEEAAKEKPGDGSPSGEPAPPSVSAAAKIKADRLEGEARLQAVLRRRQEVDLLARSLAGQVAALEAREKKLAEERARLEVERRVIVEADGSQQFKTALTTLEAQRPKDAKQMLAAMLAAKQPDQVVAYLSKMEEGKRGKVLAEFVKEDPGVAADLLERLRTRGLTPPEPLQTAAHDANPAHPAGAEQR